MNILSVIALSLATASIACAQNARSLSFAADNSRDTTATPQTTKDESFADISEFSEAIEDNSYFLEEAYNQEPGVVQHISNAAYFGKPTRSIAYSFTQEWPMGSQAHQFSVTIPYASLNSNAANGLGSGVTGYQFNVPVSRRFSNSFIAHWNSGFTVQPNVEGVDGSGSPIKRTLTAYNFGASIIFFGNGKF